METPGRGGASTVCEACGEALLTSGNYKVKVVPAKKMPRKACKLYRDPLGRENSSPWGKSKFRKYLEARSRPKNTIEITCGACSSITPIRANKPKPRISKSSSKVPGSTPGQPRRKKRPKTPKDLNAGLIIPLSMQSPSTSTPLSSSLGLGLNSSSSSSSQPKPRSSTLYGSADDRNVNTKRGSGQSGSTGKKKLDQAQKQSKRREMETLKRVLYKSKQLIRNNSSNSLQDFLGDSP